MNKVVFGPLNTATLVTASVGLPVGVLAVVPGTGATQLGKAIDTAVGSTDTGIGMLAQHQEDQIHLTTGDGDWDSMRLDSLGSLHVNPEAHHIFDSMDATTSWSVLNDGAANITADSVHQIGTKSLKFDKVDGSGNSEAVIDKTISAVDLGDIAPNDLIQTMVYLPALTLVSYIFVRLGDTDGTNYNEWRIPDTALTAATWETIGFIVGDSNFAGSNGAGWNPSAIDYIAVGVAFDAESNTMAGIQFDQLSYHSNIHTTANLTAEVTSEVTTPNINLHRVGGQPTDTGAGNVANATQRVTIASDDVNLAGILADTAAIETAVELQVYGGGNESLAQRVTIANDSTGTLTVDGSVTANAGTNLNTSALLTTSAHDAAFGTAGSADAQVRSVQGIASMTPLLVDATGSGDVPVTLGAETVVLGAGTAAYGKLAANSGVDIGDVDVTTILTGSGALNLGKIEDGPHTGGDLGVMALAIRDDALTAGALVSQDLDYLPLRTNNDGALWVQPTVGSLGGSKMFNDIDLDEADIDVATGPCTVYGIIAFNETAAPLYLKLFNTNSVTMGSTNAIASIPIPANADSDGAGFVIPIPVAGVAFGTALTVAVTTGLALDDNAAPGDNDANVTIFYQD